MLRCCLILSNVSVRIPACIIHANPDAVSDMANVCKLQASKANLSHAVGPVMVAGQTSIIKKVFLFCVDCRSCNCVLASTHFSFDQLYTDTQRVSTIMIARHKPALAARNLHACNVCWLMAFITIMQHNLLRCSCQRLIAAIMTHAGGTIISGLVGLLFRVLLGHKAWIARPLAVATSVGVLALSASPFPPGEHVVLCIAGRLRRHASRCMHECDTHAIWLLYRPLFVVAVLCERDAWPTPRTLCAVQYIACTSLSLTVSCQTTNL